MPSTQSDMQRRAVDVLGGVDRAYARVQTTLGESLRTSVLDQASSAVSEMYEAERQAREMLAERTHVADLIGDIGTAVALAQSTLAETVQTGIQRAAKLADAIDTNHYKAVEQLGLNAANHYKAVESLGFNAANRAYDIEAEIKRAADYIDTNRYNTVEGLSLIAARAAPHGSAARSGMPEAVPDVPATMPPRGYDPHIGRAEHDDSETADALMMLLACMVSLIVLLLAAQLVHPEDAISQTRLWVKVIGDAALHSPEFNGWLLVCMVIWWLKTNRRRR